MRNTSTAASGFDVVSAKDGLRQESDATAPQIESGDVTEKHLEANYSYFARYGYHDVSLKEK